MIDKRIKLLKSKFIQHKIDGYIVPKNDEFFSEYAVKDRLKIISNFNGSAGLAIILKKINYLFVIAHIHSLDKIYQARSLA